MRFAFCLWSTGGKVPGRQDCLLPLRSGPVRSRATLSKSFVNGSLLIFIPNRLFFGEGAEIWKPPLAGMNGVPARGALLGRKPGLDLAITVYAPFSWKISLSHQYILIANHQRYGENSSISFRSCLKFLAILKRLDFQGAGSGFCLPVGVYSESWLSEARR